MTALQKSLKINRLIIFLKIRPWLLVEASFAPILACIFPFFLPEFQGVASIWNSPWIPSGVAEILVSVGLSPRVAQILGGGESASLNKKRQKKEIKPNKNKQTKPNKNKRKKNSQKSLAGTHLALPNDCQGPLVSQPGSSSEPNLKCSQATGGTRGARARRGGGGRAAGQARVRPLTEGEAGGGAGAGLPGRNWEAAVGH